MSSPANTATSPAPSLLSDRRTNMRPHEWDELRATPLQAIVDSEQRLIKERRERLDICSTMPVVGLALSGGGVRSATFNLGILQALAAHHTLRMVDYLSTVSGGGYIGAFLGRFYTRFINRPKGAVDVIEERLNDVASPEISWLRHCSGYMAVSAGIETPVTTAVVLRSFLTVHIVLGILLVAVFNLANLVRYCAIDWLVNLLDPWLRDQTRLSLPVDLLPSVNPWMFVFAIAVVTSFLPLSIAYWLPSASRPESYERSRLVAFIICSATGFVMSLEAGAYFAAVSVVATTLAVFAWVRAAWARVALKSPASTVVPAGRAMVRNKVTKWLATATVVATIVLGIWILDDLVFRLYPLSMPLQGALVAIGVTFAFLFGALRWLALRLLTEASADERKLRRWIVLSTPFLLPAVSCALLLVQWDLVSHEMFRRGADVSSGFVWTVVTVVVSAILGGRRGVALVNGSSLQLLYAARGARTYLGATNPYRHSTDEGADVTSAQPEDDLPYSRYRPDLAGGPLHLINVLANQSVDRRWGRRTHDRPGANMAVGPCGVSVGRSSHSVWLAGRDTKDLSRRLVDAFELPAPFVPRRDSQSDRVGVRTTAAMMLSDWMSISGAALSPGEHSDRSFGKSLIYGLANVRAGFWWDSGIEDGDRLGEPMPSVPKRFGRWVMRRLRAQSCLLTEFTGRFGGPFRRYWYLSDGSFGDGLGVYELVRRKVPIIICADATRDAEGGLTALTNAMRRVRVDFRAEIRFLSSAELEKLVAKLTATCAVPKSVLDAIGTLEDLRSSPGSFSRKHAAIARVRYRNHSAQSVLLYVKATLTGDEEEDVLDYQRRHPRFPHQSVRDQSLTEAQWESYRQLGQHCASPLFREAGVQWLADARKALQSA